ncbi:hypothetical protein AB6A40_008564 [Gnathostoma spinigerum]|uniref:Uncharacterized protein n=1 Tax=Gnathostoma spinigerum TaxID=75299 RepID=A0ABD6EZS6_9BILA
MAPPHPQLRRVVTYRRTTNKPIFKTFSLDETGTEISKANATFSATPKQTPTDQQQKSPPEKHNLEARPAESPPTNAKESVDK